MYRARVQAVSGSKIYADGKWLTCIGNKHFAVGEPVWTDGRCAYGHFQESQQPLVITAEEDAEEDVGVPILIYQQNDSGKYAPFLYTFHGKKLKPIKLPEKFPTDRNNFYMINNKKKIYIERSDKIIAENIDKYGNIFRIVENLDIEEPAYEIRKNNEVIKSFNVDLFREKALEEAPFPIETYDVREYAHFSGPHYVEWGFIENEKNWAFTISTQSIEEVYYKHPYYIQGYMGATYSTIGNFICIYFVNQDAIFSMIHSLAAVLPEISSDSVTILRPRQELSSFNCPDLDKIKFPMQDNYYYQFSRGDDEEHNYLMNLSLYSPKGENLFNLISSPEARLVMTKIKSSYLLGFRSSYASDYDKNGIYLYNKGELELITKGNLANQIFQPMEKIKGWQNRIKEISLNLEQDEN